MGAAFRRKKGLNILIIGCGTLGLSLVDRLSKEGHSIAVIDANEETIRGAVNRFDVLGVVGNGARFPTQLEAGIQRADLLISAAPSDELNLLCCITAKRSPRCAVMARVRTPDYSEDAAYWKEKLGLAMLLNPEREAAGEIAQMLTLPAAAGVTSLAGGQGELLRIRIPADSALHGKTLGQLRPLTGTARICAVERGREVCLPAVSFRLRSGDEIGLLCPARDVRPVLRRMGLETRPAGNVLIVGGGTMGYDLARRLLSLGTGVRIIESSRRRCEALSVLLPKAAVICGDGTDAAVLQAAGIERAEAVVPLTGVDEVNFMLALRAQGVSRARVVTKADRLQPPPVMERLRLDGVVCPGETAADAVAAYARSRTAAGGSGIAALHRLFGRRAEVIEFTAHPDARLLNIPLRKLPLKDHLRVACISRAGALLMPDGDACMRAGDAVVVVTTHTGLLALEDILA